MVVPLDSVLGEFSFPPRRGAAAAARKPVARPAIEPGHVDGEALLEIARFAVPLKRRIAAMLPLRPGLRVLDVGCGPGADTTMLAPLLSPGGRIVGVDRDANLLEIAQSRTQRSPEARLANHLRADAVHLPFASEAFDVCRCERLLQHVRDGDRAVSEMVRVTKRGGIVVAADSDWASLSIDADDPAVERDVVRSVTDALNDGYAGRALPRRLSDAGLVNIRVDVVLVHWTNFQTIRRTSFMVAGLHRQIVDGGQVSEQDWARFERGLELADQRGRFFATATVVVAAGRRPTGPGDSNGASGEVQ